MLCMATPYLCRKCDGDWLVPSGLLPSWPPPSTPKAYSALPVCRKLKLSAGARAELSPLQATLGSDGRLTAERLDVRIKTGQGRTGPCCVGQCVALCPVWHEMRVDGRVAAGQLEVRIKTGEGVCLILDRLMLRLGG